MWDWVFTQGKQLLDTPIDLEILLLPKTTASNNSSSRDISGLLATRKGLPYADMARETDLIDLQIHAFQAIEERMTWPILQFDPFLNPDDIRSEVIQNIDHNLERNELRMTKPRHCGRTYLSEAISRLSRAEISNTIWLCRGIVEKGYSDNDVDVMCKDLGDFPLLLKAGGPIELHLLPYSPEEETWKMRLLPPK